MTGEAPRPTLAAYREAAFARHMLFDLPFPVMGTVLVVALIAWLMHGRVPDATIAAWALFAAVSVVAREVFVRRMKVQHDRGVGHRRALNGLAVLSIPIGAVSGIFACLYFDPHNPFTMVILGTYMTVVVVGAVVPTAAHLPCFYLLVLPAHLPYLLQLLRSGGTEHLVTAGINVLFLGVVSSYAQAAHQMQRESIRLRFDNQQLIDDLERRKGDAEEASRSKSLFLAGVSHDLKQPISAVGLYSGFLRHRAAKQHTPPQLVADTAAKIEEAVGNLHAQIDRLLELSRLESGAMPMRPERLDLDDVIRAALAVLAPQAQARGVQLRWALGRQREVWADPRMLDSILSNLLSNAIKHAEGGRVYVGTRWRHTGGADGLPRFCIEVRDSGTGISPEQLPLLFDAYRSFDDRQASASHGLGLAIAKAQASYLGCDIHVRSRNPIAAARSSCAGWIGAAPMRQLNCRSSQPD